MSPHAGILITPTLLVPRVAPAPLQASQPDAGLLLANSHFAAQRLLAARQDAPLPAAQMRRGENKTCTCSQSCGMHAWARACLEACPCWSCSCPCWSCLAYAHAAASLSSFAPN